VTSSNRRCPICTLYHRSNHKALCRAIPNDHRWPLAPLLDLRPNAPETLRPHGHDQRSLTAWAEHGLDDRTADRVATLLHLHPVQVWGWEWIDLALTPLDAQRIAGGWRHAWTHQEQLEQTA